MTSLAVLAILSLQTATLSVEVTGENVAAVLRKVSSLSGTTHEVKGDLAEEIIALRLAESSPEIFRENLAKALDATWIREGNKHILTRTTTNEKEIWNRHLDLRKQFVEDIFNTLSAQVSPEFDARGLVFSLKALPDQSDRTFHQRLEAVSKKGAIARLLKRLVMACNQEDLASVGQYERAVFKVNPTKRQKRIDPTAFKRAFDEFKKENDQWLEAASNQDFGDASNMTVSDPRSQTKYKALDPERVSLHVKRGDMAGFGMVNLVYSESPGSRPNILAQEFLADPARMFLNSMQNPPSARSDLPSAELSVEAKESMMALRSFNTGTPLKLSETTLLALAKPTERDPNSLFFGEIVIDYAKQNKLNLIASLTDPMSTVSMFLNSTKIQPAETTISQLIQAGSLKKEEGSKDFVLFTTKDRYEDSQAFTNRMAMEDLIKAELASNLGFNELCKYAFESKRLTRYGIGETYLGMYNFSKLLTLLNSDWEAAKIYGSFTAAQKKILEANNTIPFAGLRPEQKALVERLIYNAQLDSDEVLEQNSRQLGSFLEPTDAFPEKLPEGTNVHLSEKSIPTIVSYTKDSNGQVKPGRTINTYTLANYIVDKEPVKYSLSNLEGFAMAKTRFIQIRIYVAKDTFKNLVVETVEYDSKAKPGPYTSLPESVRNEITNYVTELEKAAANKRIVPPPHYH